MKVLLVEDEEKLAKNLKKGLQREGYIVHSFPTAEDAEKFLSKHHESIDIVLLDFMLPGKSGTEMYTGLRKKGINLPVIMLTARDMPQDIIDALDSGVDDYLTKPFSFAVLLARMRALLRRSSKEDQSPSLEIRLGGLVLQKAARKLFFKNKEIPLTLKEFNLLQYMLERPNTVLEREILLEKIWDINFDSFSNVVDVHVKNIRKKLKKTGKAAVIETVRGIGYRILK